MGTAAEEIFYLSSNLMNLSSINFAESGLNQFGVKKKFCRTGKDQHLWPKMGDRLGRFFSRKKLPNMDESFGYFMVVG